MIKKRGACKVLQKIALAKHSEIVSFIDKHVRDKILPRISVSDRCLTIADRSFNLQNGNSWNYFLLSSQENKKIPNLEIISLQNLPFSNIQLALGKNEN